MCVTGANLRRLCIPGIGQYENVVLGHNRQVWLELLQE